MSRKATFADAADGGWGTSKRRAGEAELDITPMIDVTFLLLIFFMVASTMQATPDQQLPAARYGKGLEVKDALVITIGGSSVAGEEPALTIDGRSATIESVTPEVEAAAQAGTRHVIVKGDGRLTNGYIKRVLQAIQEVDDVTFAIGVRDRETE